MFLEVLAGSNSIIFSFLDPESDKKYAMKLVVRNRVIADKDRDSYNNEKEIFEIVNKNKI
jgi:hypothetical protein